MFGEKRCQSKNTAAVAYMACADTSLVVVVFFAFGPLEIKYIVKV